ncbi:MAG: carboxylating nicotinate-nucleotide diphosphorylase [Chromatiales bacterium]|nr:carboxylating nicotinate-nucleotide diphosphorylase [Chromatiales bacterium]
MKHIISLSDQYFSPGVCPVWLYEAVQENVSAALAEDLPASDLSTDTTVQQISREAVIRSNDAAVIAGQFWVDEVFRQMPTEVTVDWQVQDGQSVPAKQQLCTITGHQPAMLQAERCALNFLQTLSGTATTVARYVAQLDQTSHTQITDTRKTIPGLRLAQKYAVVCGGGISHRFNLSDGVLLKDNHITMYGSITRAVAVARSRAVGQAIEIEVRTLPQIQQALSANVDVIMLDNFALDDIAKALTMIDGQAKVEISGNLGLEDIKTVADYGVDYISIGALTKHLHAIDMSMTIKE